MARNMLNSLVSSFLPGQSYPKKENSSRGPTTRDTNGNLLTGSACDNYDSGGGVCLGATTTYSYDTANRMTGYSDGTSTHTCACDGLSAAANHYRQTADGVTTYMLDDGSRVYLYGSG